MAGEADMAYGCFDTALLNVRAPYSTLPKILSITYSIFSFTLSSGKVWRNLSGAAYPAAAAFESLRVAVAAEQQRPCNLLFTLNLTAKIIGAPSYLPCRR